MCRGCTEIVLTFWARHMRMLSTFPTVDSSHQSLRWLSLCSCVLVKILISSCIICHWNISFFFVTYFPPLSSCLLCKKTLDSFFFFLLYLFCQFLPLSPGWPLALESLNCGSLSQDMSGIKFSGTFICVTFMCLGRCCGCLWQCICSDSNVKRRALPLLKFCLFYSFDETAWIGGEYWRSLKNPWSGVPCIPA